MCVAARSPKVWQMYTGVYFHTQKAQQPASKKGFAPHDLPGLHQHQNRHPWWTRQAKTDIQDEKDTESLGSACWSSTATKEASVIML